MQQQVNLLSDDLRRGRDPLTFNQLLVIWGIFGAGLALFTGWDGISLWQLSSEHEQSEAQRRMLVQANDALKAEFDSRMDPGLKAHVDDLRARQREQRQLMDLLLGYTSSQHGGFSTYLGDLSDHTVDGMWLSQISLEDGGSRIHLKGTTTDAVHLPEFLQGLSQGSSFRGHRFDDFEIKENDAGLLDFDITGPDEATPG